MYRTRYAAALTGLIGLLAACEEDQRAEQGKLRVSLRAEDTITDGLSVGNDEENTRDYAVSYTKFIVAVGKLRLGQATSGKQLASDAVYLVDLKQVGEQAVELAEFGGVRAGEWDQFAFETPAAADSTEALDVAPGDAQDMIDHGWTYWIEGSVQRPQADGGPVDFVIQTAVPTLFKDCELDGEPGVTVIADQTATGDITIHGDHIWFNSFPTGSEGSVERRAAWLLEADRDGDGKVSTEDLAALDATEVFTTQLGYSLDGAPEEIPIDSALDFVRAQLATQGHFRGEGECIWHFEGASGG
jgi:hypothetical protein